MNLTTVIQDQKLFFMSATTLSYTHRISTLTTLKTLLIKNQDAIYAALKSDLNKSNFESFLSEYALVLNELNHTLSQLKKWMKPQKMKTPLSLFPSKSFTLHEPYGVVLIMSPWNYPIQLTLSPLIGAIAAGNTVIIKTSKSCVATSSLLYKLLNETFNQHLVYVIDQSVDYETILNQTYDYIFFTGSPSIGQIVAKKALDHFTPYTLELGGKSPCFIDELTDLKTTCKRIVFGKLMNAGQTCIAPDYFLVDEKITGLFITELISAITAVYPDAINHPDYPCIINEKHFNRLNDLIKNSTVLYGGETNPVTRKIAPTILGKVSFNDLVMQEELFGPLFPIISYTNIDEVITSVLSLPKPLACYVFSKKQAYIQTILNRISFGGGCINDCLMHISNDQLPFGGVGQSGSGRYHGYHSFKTFSNEKGLIKNTLLFELPFRYHKKYSALISRIMRLK